MFSTDKNPYKLEANEIDAFTNYAPQPKITLT